MAGMRVYICDIDGTVADATHRLSALQERPKNWDSFFGSCPFDTPFPHMQELLSSLKLPIMYVSGRPERLKNVTVAWLKEHKFPFFSYLPFHMRKDGDRRDDTIVKREILNLILADGYVPVLAFDDRDRVVAMWRENGIPCLQVAAGNF